MRSNSSCQYLDGKDVLKIDLRTGLETLGRYFAKQLTNWLSKPFHCRHRKMVKRMIPKVLRWGVNVADKGQVP